MKKKYFLVAMLGIVMAFAFSGCYVERYPHHHYYYHEHDRGYHRY